MDAMGTKEVMMLGAAILFLILALIAAIFGLGLVASAAVGIAKILLVVFLVLFLVSLVGYFLRGTGSRV